MSSPRGGWSEQEARAVNPEQHRGHIMLWCFYLFLDQTNPRVTKSAFDLL